MQEKAYGDASVTVSHLLEACELLDQSPGGRLRIPGTSEVIHYDAAPGDRRGSILHLCACACAGVDLPAVWRSVSTPVWILPVVGMDVLAYSELPRDTRDSLIRAMTSPGVSTQLIRRVLFDGVRFGPLAKVGVGVSIGVEVVLDGLCVVKQDVVIHDGVWLGTATVVEDAAVLGAGARAWKNVYVGCRAVIGSGVVLGTCAYIGDDSVLDSGVIVPAGAIVPPGSRITRDTCWRADGRPVGAQVCLR